jgi:hypothetical protein
LLDGVEYIEVGYKKPGKWLGIRRLVDNGAV